MLKTKFNFKEESVALFATWLGFFVLLATVIPGAIIVSEPSQVILWMLCSLAITVLSVIIFCFGYHYFEEFYFRKNRKDNKINEFIKECKNDRKDSKQSKGIPSF